MRVALSMWAAGLGHVLWYAVPSILAWNVRVMDLQFWGMDILMPTVFAGLVVAAHTSRVSRPIAQIVLALCALAAAQTVMSFLSVTVAYGLDGAAGFGLSDVIAYYIFASVPTAVVFIIVLVVAEIDRVLTWIRVRRNVGM